MSRKKLKQAYLEHMDMATRPKRRSRSRAKVSVMQEAREIGPDFEEDFYDLWHDWDEDYDDY
jgi:hypothetical protein